MQSMTYRRGGGSSRAVSASVVDLIDPAGLMVKRIESLRTHAWEVELAAHGIDSASLTRQASNWRPRAPTSTCWTWRANCSTRT